MILDTNAISAMSREDREIEIVVQEVYDTVLI
jgi:hypothetical protein